MEKFSKKIILVALLLLASLLICGCSNHKKEEKIKKIPQKEESEKIEGYNYENRYLTAILPFENKCSKKEFDTTISNGSGRLLSILTSTERFRVIEREKLNRIVDENKLVLAGMTQNEAAYEIGKIINAEVIILTDITKAQYTEDGSEIGSVLSKVQSMEVTVETRVVLVKSGEILASAIGEAKEKNGYNITGSIKNGSRMDEKILFEKGLEKAINEAGEKLSKKMPKKII